MRRAPVPQLLDVLCPCSGEFSSNRFPVATRCLTEGAGFEAAAVEIRRNYQYSVSDASTISALSLISINQETINQESIRETTLRVCAFFS